LPCHDNYIELDSLIPSRTGLYANTLPGIDIELIDGLRKNGLTSDSMWTVLYNRAWVNMVADASKNLQDKFFVDTKLISRETSSFEDDYNSAGVAGVKINFNISKYTKVHVVSIEVWSQIAYTSVPINFYDTDEDGEVLHTVTTDLAAGRNTINVDTDFEVVDLFIAIDTAIYTVKQTENKFYAGMRQVSDYLSSVICEFDTCGGGTGSVQQINGGGVNAKYVVYCSIDKFCCENINLFKMPLYWRIGVEITEERRFGERLNQYTTMDANRAAELQQYYLKRYELEMENSVKSHNIIEDTVCFNCKSTVYVQTSLP
jgi:hypothetical protein